MNYTDKFDSCSQYEQSWRTCQAVLSISRAMSALSSSMLKKPARATDGSARSVRKARSEVRSSGFEVPKTSNFGPRTVVHLARPASLACFVRLSTGAFWRQAMALRHCVFSGVQEDFHSPLERKTSDWTCLKNDFYSAGGEMDIPSCCLTA